MNIEFVKEKETAGTWRFKEVPDEDHQDRPAMGALYILKKDIKALGSPERVLVTITPVQ